MSPVTRCPHCSYEVLPNTTTCPQCDRLLLRAAALSPYEQTATTPTPPSNPPMARSVSRVVWVLALIGIVLAAINGFGSLALAESAPQQAAGAAMSCFYLIAAYTFARAVDALTR